MKSLYRQFQGEVNLGSGLPIQYYLFRYRALEKSLVTQAYSNGYGATNKVRFQHLHHSGGGWTVTASLTGVCL